MEILALPWQQLRALELNYTHPVDDVLSLLSIAKDLERFSYRARTRDIKDRPSTPAPTIIHHSLRDLSIVMYEDSMATNSARMSFLLQHLTLLALRSATLGKCGPAELVTFSEFQDRSQFTLDALEFTATGWYRGEQDAAGPLLRFLLGNPSLVRMHFGIIEVGEDSYERFLKMLELRRYAPDDPGSGLLPCVEDIQLQLSNIVDGQAIMDILRTRWRPEGGRCLTRFGVGTMHGHGPPFRRTGAVTDQLCTFVREGLVLHIDNLHPVWP